MQNKHYLRCSGFGIIVNNKKICFFSVNVCIPNGYAEYLIVYLLAYAFANCRNVFVYVYCFGGCGIGW